MNPQRHHRRRGLLIAGLSVLLAGGVLYPLANRYLIEHVEVSVPSVSAAGIDSNSGENQAANKDSGTAVKSDDWNYSSNDLNISIKKVVTGSGSDQITYYVANVKTSNTDLLIPAFAKNEFGRNITETTSEIASAHQAVFAINGDYYGFRRQEGSRGMTLDEFARAFADLGAKEAYNLDGGGSSTMYFMGRVVNNPQGKQEERGVSDILYFGEG